METNLKKKIGFLLTSESLGGLELNVINTVEHFHKNFPSDFPLFISKNAATLDRAKEKKLNITLLPSGPKYFNIKCIIKLLYFLNKNPIDFLYLSSEKDIDLGFWCKIFLQLFYKKKLQLIYVQQMQLGIHKKDFYHTLKYLSLFNWITPLESLKIELLHKTHFHKNKIKVIPLSMDTYGFVKKLSIHKNHIPELKIKYNISEKDFVFSILGRIDPGKGQLEVLENFLQIILNFPNSKLLIIGSPTHQESLSVNYYDQIKALIKSKSPKIQEQIILISHVDDPTTIYSLTDCLIVSSQKETFGMVTIEGLLSETIVMGKKSGGTIELLNFGNRGILYDPHISNDLQNQMLKLLILNQQKKLNKVSYQKEVLFEFSYFKMERFFKDLMIL